MSDLFERTLIIATHCDDEVLSCGGLIYKLRKEDKPVKVVTTCIYRDLERRAIRYSEYEKAMKLLKVDDYMCLNLPDGTCDKSVSIMELCTLYDNIIDNYNPTAVLIPCSAVHQDHEFTHKAALASLRPRLGINYIKFIAFHTYPFTYTWNHDNVLQQGKYYVPLSEEERCAKIDALNCYKSQLIRDDRDLLSVEASDDLLRVTGREIGHYYAESYIPVRVVY